MTTEQEVLDDLIQAITNTNTSNDDFLKVLKEGRDQDVALRDGTVVPSLTKRVVNAFSNSDYLMKADNLASVIDKQEARDNLEVYSKIEVDDAISSASSPETPNATETTAGKAKIATTAIAQAGTNDTDIITPLKLKNTIFGLGQNRKVVTKVSGTTYTNTTGKPIGFEVIFKSTGSSVTNMDSNITVNSEIRQRLVWLVDATYRCSMFVIVLPNESYSFNAGNLASIEKVTEIS